jgi:hypothetical protein
MSRFFVFFLCLALASCANAPSGSQDTVRFISNPAGATMTSSTGFSCTTPCEQRVRRDLEFSALFEKSGYQSATVSVATKTTDFEKSYDLGPMSFGVAAASITGDDTGLYNTQHVPNPVSVDLLPLKTPSAR